MAGLNHIREAYEQVYAQLDERMDPEERALRRAEVADKKASRMDPKVADKYAGSEARSAERADKKSRGKHIHGMADSYEAEGELVDEAKVDAGLSKNQKIKSRENRSGLGGFDRTMSHIETRGEKKTRGEKEDSWWKTKFTKDKSGKVTKHRSWHVSHESDRRARIEKEEFEIDEAVYGGKKEEPKDTRMTVTAADQKGNTPAWKRYQAGHPGYKAAPHLTKEEMIAHLKERALDAAEKREKESVYKAIKPSKLAKTYPEKSPQELKSLRYAISTSQAKKNMDTSRSDKRYGVEN